MESQRVKISYCWEYLAMMEESESDEEWADA